MKLDQKVLGHYGATDNIKLASWMLPDGVLINGSKEGLQRDYDHRDIAQFYPNLCEYDAVQAFMRHGAVRMGCADGNILFEFARPLAAEQKNRLGALARVLCVAEFMGGPAAQFCAMRHTRKGETVCDDVKSFATYLANYCSCDPIGAKSLTPDGLLMNVKWAELQLQGIS